MLHVESFSTKFSNQDTKELSLPIRFFISYVATMKMDVELFKHVSLSRGSVQVMFNTAVFSPLKNVLGGSRKL